MKWKEIPGYTRYEASTGGEIRRCRRVGNYLPGRMPTYPNRGGYPCVSITGDDGKCRKIPVHTLVMLAFVGVRPSGKETCHNNGDRSDARLSNLRYDTCASNAADRILHGTALRGEQSPQHVITEAQARAIYARCAANEPHASIAADYEITTSMVCRISTRKGWKCLGLPRLKHVRKLSDDQVIHAHRLVSGGMSKSAVGRHYGTSPQTISYALKNRLPTIQSGAPQ